jgi:hypothetical protein
LIALGIGASRFAVRGASEVTAHRALAAAIGHANVSILESVISGGAKAVVIENEILGAPLFEPHASVTFGVKSGLCLLLCIGKVGANARARRGSDGKSSDTGNACGKYENGRVSHLNQAH